MGWRGEVDGTAWNDRRLLCATGVTSYHALIELKEIIPDRAAQ